MSQDPNNVPDQNKDQEDTPDRGEEIFPTNDDVKNRQVPEGDTASADKQSEVGDRLQNVVEEPGELNPGEGKGPTGVTGGNEGDVDGPGGGGEPPGEHQKVTGETKNRFGQSDSDGDKSGSPR